MVKSLSKKANVLVKKSEIKKSSSLPNNKEKPIEYIYVSHDTNGEYVNVEK